LFSYGAILTAWMSFASPLAPCPSRYSSITVVGKLARCCAPGSTAAPTERNGQHAASIEAAHQAAPHNTGAAAINAYPGVDGKNAARIANLLFTA
jgi:hypothetical protein